ncbi:hypothetical protein MKEN_01170900 [Mycena kentingensis (nom. inval.)]|nr:hypothetical protein MKEN_01170900 [Mycena kentingensis (nom. inval.)]
MSLLQLALLGAASLARADYFSKDPLVDKVVPYDQIPYQVMTDRDDPRGFQTGYNICNATTENQDSMCQTMFVNHIDDLCLWAPPKPNTTIAESEGEEVAWCSKKGHGTRLIPAGALLSVQYIQTPSYIQIAGAVNQAMLNIGGTDGGELDSGGQDGEGNPMGGLVYSNAFPSAGGNNGTFVQAQHWSFFIGNNYFCGKICDQTGSNPQGLCNNIYDRLGCDYNAPASVQPGTFEVCKGDDMTPVGTYTGADSKTSVYHQPPEDVPIDFSALPYSPTPAPSSSCTPFASTALYTDLAAVTAAPGNGASASGSAPTGSGAGSSGGAGAGSGTGSAGAPGQSQSGTPTGAARALCVHVGIAVLSAAVVAVGMVL